MGSESIPGVNIIMGVTAAVAGVVGVVAALSSVQDTEAAKIRKLTEASRQEYEQIQKLKAEYEEVVATYGETSDQAVYLAWRIDELTESYQNSKQTLEEYVAECDELNDSLRADLSAIRETFDSIDSSEGTTLGLVHVGAGIDAGQLLKFLDHHGVCPPRSVVLL